MLDHLMRRPTDLPLKNGGSVRLKPLSLRDMGMVLAEQDPMRRMAVAAQRSILDENDNLAFSIAPVHYILDENGDLVLSADPVDYVFDEMDQRVLTEIGIWLINGPEGGDADPLSDSLAPTPTDAE